VVRQRALSIVFNRDMLHARVWRNNHIYDYPNIRLLS